MGIAIQGKTALVTGANRGIGRAIVDSLIKHGAAKVYAAVRKLASAESLIAEHGNKVVAVKIDLNEPETITAAARQCGDVEIVISNAGILKVASPLASDAIESLQSEIDVNVYGLLRMAQAFAPLLKANGGGALVQLNSVASYLSFPDFATYAASKAAAYSLTQALRVKLAEQGTTVVSVHPGPIATDMAHDAGLDEVAEPASQVGEAIVEALQSGTFHVYTDTMAKQIGSAYASFAESVIEAGGGE